MVALTVDQYGYLSMTSEEWLDDVSTSNESLTADFVSWLDANHEGDYVSDEIVKEWLETLGNVSGLYGDDNVSSVVSCNMDTFLSDDISYVFAHVENEETDFFGTFIIVNGYGYMSAKSSGVEIRDFIGDDDADAFSISSGYCAHDTMDWKDDKRVNCETEWILDNPVTLWPNGGGHSYRIENYILGTFDSDGWEDITESKLYCPECGDTLSPYSN